MRKSTDPRFVSDIKTAIMRERPVTITYVTESGRTVVRTIEPYAVVKVESTGNHLIKSMDRESGKHRSWRVDRVLTYTVSRGRFLVARPEDKAARELAAGWADWAEQTYDPDVDGYAAYDTTYVSVPDDPNSFATYAPYDTLREQEGNGS